MAQRPAYIAMETGPALVQVTMIGFTWHAGMALSRKRMSIHALHEAIREARPNARILEVSTASESDLGQSLSAFNLTFHSTDGSREIAVECAFQGAKVFENGGPYTDLRDVRPIDAKRDPRLQTSGRLIRFQLKGQDWPLEPLTAFYDWVYLNALYRRPELAEAVLSYDTFTDIAFNPERSINCQAGSVALFVALARRGMLSDALTSREAYLSAIGGEGQGVRAGDDPQRSMF